MGTDVDDVTVVADPTAGDGFVIDVVIPTIGRHTLDVLLERLASDRDRLGSVVVVDDRRGAARDDLSGSVPAALRHQVRVVRTGGRGPAAARNAGWRATSASWVAFVDDDVVPGDGWAAALCRDARSADPITGAVAARLHVPLPADRRPTDRERQVKALETAGWITADLVVRREVLDGTGGFDERFPRAHREDTDFAVRAQRAGWHFQHGERRSVHPVQPAPWWHSVAAQRGNRDDVLMLELHGWRPDVTRRRRHLFITACALVAVIGCATRRRWAVVAGAVGWLMGTGEFVAARVAPGPRTPHEVAAMVVTSVAIPPVAVAHRWRARAALWRHRIAPAGAQLTL
jgi:hypothetical protein